MATFRQVKAFRAQIEADVALLGAVVNGFPKTGAMGLTPDAVKASPEYRAAKALYDAAFDRLRRVNAHLVKTFPAELRAERLQRRASIKVSV